MNFFNSLPRTIIATLSLTFLFHFSAFAQRPYWMMMQDSIIDYQGTVNAFESEWAGKTPEKGQGYKQFRRWQYMQSLRLQPDGTLPPTGYEAAEMERWEMEDNNYRRSSTVPTGNWTPMGPIAFPSNMVGQPGGIARTTTIEFHPTNVNRIYAGAPAGGLWVSNDAGVSWTTNTDFLPTLGVSAIAIDPVTPTTIYIGTGDKDGGDASGLGVYKSINDGATFTVSNTGMGNRTVHSLVMDPNNVNVIIAATTNGIYRSVNAGANWTQVLASGTTYQVDYQPGSNSVIYAINATNFYVSTDDGATWGAGVPIATSARGAFATSPADPNSIWVVKDVGINPVFRSTNGGASFTSVQTDGKVLLNGSCAGTGAGGQGWYDICIAVDPLDVNKVYVGGVSLWKSADSGVNFSIMACWSSMATNVHADHHCLNWSPHYPNRLYICNDGGVYFTDNATSFSNISSGIAASLIYRVGLSANDPDMIVAGFQDNGMLISRQPNWYITVGGDGLECAIDPTDNNYQYGSYVNGVIRRSTNGGWNWGTISGSIPETGPWLTPYTLQPGNPDVMIAGYVSLWRSSNVKSAGPTWTNVQTFASSTIRDIHFADANTVYASRSNGEFWQSTDAGLTWAIKTNPPGGAAEDIAADPSIPNSVWVASGNNIYQSLNGGTTWTLWDTGLPNIAALTVVYDHVADALYCGMWTGVYYRHVSDPSWIAFNTGLPNTQAHHLQIFYDQNGCVGRDKLRLATYGRGLWESDLYAPPTLAPIACFGADTTNVCAAIGVITLRDSSAYDPTSWLWTITGPGSVTFTGGTSNTSQNPQVILGSVGLYTVTLQATNVNGSDSKTRINYINAVLPSVNFTSADSLIYEGQNAVFVNTSASCTSSWLWDFGDGFTSTAQNPTHTYATAGLYSVTLTVNGGINSIVRTNYIQVLPHLPVPFTAVTAGWTGDMESNLTAWHFGDKRMGGTVNNWERGSVTLTFPPAASGVNCWATDLDANVPQATYSSSVYTPTFDLSAPGNYQVRLKTVMQQAFCNAPIGVRVDYSTDLGATWTRLGGKQGTDPDAFYNWYSHGGTGGCDNASVIPGGQIGWNYAGATAFRQAIYDASALAGNSRVAFRVAFYSSGAYGAFTSKGFAFDDFEIDYDPTPVATDTIPGRLVAFDGVDDYVETYYNANLSPFSIEAWVMSPAAPAGTARTSILQKTNVIEFTWNHPTAASRGAVAMRNTGGTWQNFTFGPLAASTWYHLAVTFDGTTVRTYKNGVLITSAAFSGTLTTNTNPFQLGIGSAYFSGQVDEFRMWNVARSQTEIREAMHRTLDPGECTNVVVYYQSNEATGYLRDAIRLRHGYLMNGLGRTLSPVAVGRGVSQTMSITGTGLFDYTIPDLKLNFTAAAGAPFEVVVTRINQLVNEQTPNPLYNAAPNATLVDRNQYFYHVINKFGGGAFSTDITVEGMNDVTATEAATPSSQKLVKRLSNSVGLWDVGIPATVVTPTTSWDGTALFPGITTFSQLFVGSEIGNVLSAEALTLFALPDEETDAILVSLEITAPVFTDHFSLERMEENAGGTPQWREVAGFDAGASVYHYTDPEVIANEVMYYRVKFTDANGTEQYSNIASAMLGEGSNQLLLFPNPAQHIITAHYTSSGGSVALTLTDSRGRIVWQQTDSLPSTGGSMGVRSTVDVSQLAEGLYFLQVNDSGKTLVGKVVVGR